MFGYEALHVQIAVEFLGVIVSAFIAIAGAIIAYRTTYGSKPLYMLSAYGTSYYTDEKKELSVFAEIQFWNNRSYPVRLGCVYYTYDNISLRQKNTLGHGEKNPHTAEGRTAICYPGGEVILEKGQSFRLRSIIPLADEKQRGIKTRVRVKVSYIDPLSGKAKYLHGRYEQTV